MLVGSGEPRQPRLLEIEDLTNVCEDWLSILSGNVPRHQCEVIIGKGTDTRGPGTQSGRP